MLEKTPATVAHIIGELRKTIVGQDDVIEQILVALFAEGHALLEGVPGTAKTLIVKTLAQIIGANFSRNHPRHCNRSQRRCCAWRHRHGEEHRHRDRANNHQRRVW